MTYFEAIKVFVELLYICRSNIFINNIQIIVLIYQSYKCIKKYKTTRFIVRRLIRQVFNETRTNVILRLLDMAEKNDVVGIRLTDDNDMVIVETETMIVDQLGHIN